jgi:bifunctional non-homologous end joining protein LigD
MREESVRKPSRGQPIPDSPLSSLPDSPPAFIPPMQAKLVDRVPVGEQWRYELKLDGYRALAIKTANGAKLISRNEKELSRNYPKLVDAVRLIPFREGVLDGEIVAVDAAGKPSFQALQHQSRLERDRYSVFFFVFDLLNLEGKALLSLSLLERKRLLEVLLQKPPRQVRLVGFLDGQPDAILKAVRERNLEGIVAKLASSRYEPGKRSGAWIKFKCGHCQDFVVGGYTRGSGERGEFGALIVGYYDQGHLCYASKVGTGFSTRQIREFLGAVTQIKRKECPFESIPESGGSRWGYGLSSEERRTAVWLEPLLVCLVRFTEWTDDGHLRHPLFEGFRAEKSATAVRRL